MRDKRLPPESASRPRDNLRTGPNWPFVVDGKRVSVPVGGNLSVNSARSARDFALGGGGIVHCPAYVVGRDIRAGRLVPFLAEFKPADLNVFAIFNSGRNLAPKVRVFVDFLSETFKGTPDWDAF